MKKEEILKVVRSNEGTVLSFPDRGPWGNNRYRGNCSGYIHAFLIDQYNVDFMAEMYAGGGTGYDERSLSVCKVQELLPEPATFSSQRLILTNKRIRIKYRAAIFLKPKGHSYRSSHS